MLAALVNPPAVHLKMKLLFLSLACHLPSTDQAPVRGGEAVAQLRRVTIAPIAASMARTNVGGEAYLVLETRLVERSVHETHCRGREGQRNFGGEE